MMFKRQVQRYGHTPEAITPYQRAAQLWDERIGAARVQARNWRLMAFGCLTLATGLSAALVWQAGQSRVTPFVVEVDRFGETRAIAPAIQDYQPTDAQIAWHLGQFIAHVRGLSTDPVLVRRDWLAAYDFATDRAARFLDDYARTADPFGQIGVRSVMVQIASVVRASDSSFQVKWNEQAFERGSPAGITRWTAMLTVILRPPHSEEALRRNPLGLFVTAIDWSRELDPPGAIASPPTERRTP